MNIPEAIDGLDFHKIQKAMIATNWTWKGEPPTIKDMKNTAEMCLYGAVYDSDSPLSLFSTGGFTALYNRKTDTGLVMFVLEHSPICALWDTIKR